MLFLPLNFVYITSRRIDYCCFCSTTLKPEKNVVGQLVGLKGKSKNWKVVWQLSARQLCSFCPTIFQP